MILYLILVYATFNSSNRSALIKMLHLSDEDRWGLYYGVRALARDNDPEAMVFWSLLDETFSEDGAQFIIYCLSVLLSIGGSKLWKQFGNNFNDCGNINIMVEEDESFKPVIWLEIDVAKEAIKTILTKALSSQITDAMDAVEALKARPTKEELADIGIIEADEEELKDQSDETKSEKKVPFSRRASTVKMETYKPSTHLNLFIWLRIMLQQIHADQIHRAAAIRLMFETASVGALTPNFYNTSDAPTHVEYPQFQSICHTLFPYLATTEIATLFAVCHDNGKQKITADVFVKCASRKGYFSYALKLAQLPLLTQHVDSSKLGDVSIEDAAIINVLSSKLRQASEKKKLVDKLEDMVVDSYTMKTEKILRSKLATMIHRKLAIMLPSLRIISKMAPIKWKIALQDAIDNVKSAINESHAKMVLKFSQTDGSIVVPPSRHFIDGIQPFVSYRRLLALASLIKLISDNPLLPTEFFSISDVDNSIPSLDMALYRAETFLYHLEQAILARSTNSKDSVDAFLRYKKYDEVRKTLIARRIQLLYKTFVSKEPPIPRIVRAEMSIGYLCHSGKTKTHAKYYLKNREVYYEPWYVLTIIAEIYRYKLQYDMKAIATGFEPIELSKAIVAYSFEQWGSIEMAERGIQDLFQNIRCYRPVMSRVRLFGAFVGDPFELDNDVAEVLQTHFAIFTYLNLLLDVHKEWKSYILREREIHAPTANKEINALGIMIEVKEPEVEVAVPDIINGDLK